MKLHPDEWLELFDRFVIYTDYDGAISLHCKECTRIDKVLCTNDLSRQPTRLPDIPIKAIPSLRKLNRIALKHIKGPCLVNSCVTT